MKPETYITNSNKETKELGKKLAKEILKSKPKWFGKLTARGAFVIGLKGDLGGGKTTFIQGFALGLGIKGKVLSPTFVIMKRFQVSSRLKRDRFQALYHIDCYRMKNSKELLDLGFKKIVSDSKNIVAIEWAERVKKILPKNTLWIKFDFVDIKKRKIKFSKSF